MRDDSSDHYSSLTIRAAVLDDAPRLAVLSDVLGYPIETDRLVERLARLASRAEAVVLVAVLDSGRVVGWIHGAEQELLETGRRCEIGGLVVDGGHRRHGAGRRLVQAIEAWAAARGIDEITVRSNVLRTESHPFYEALGYVRTKTQHAYRKRIP